jgi:hypothetical protein
LDTFSFTPHPWLTPFESDLLAGGTMQLGTTSTPTVTPTLPDLDPGITLLDTEASATGAVQALTLNRILLAGPDGESDGYWIGDGRHARTDGLHSVDTEHTAHRASLAKLDHTQPSGT